MDLEYNFGKSGTFDFEEKQKSLQKEIDKLQKDLSKLNDAQRQDTEILKNKGLVLKVRDTKNGERVQAGDLDYSAWGSQEWPL